MPTAFVIEDHDEALAFFTGALGFEFREDVRFSERKRWVVVGPRGGEASLLLAHADGSRQRAAVGAQTGGGVFLFLATDDFARDHAAFTATGVRFGEEPRR